MHIICGPFTIRVTGVKSVYVCPFVRMCYAPKPLNRIQSNFMCNQLPVMCTAHDECTIITVMFQTEYVEDKLDDQTDSHVPMRTIGQFPGLSLRHEQDCPDRVHNLVPIWYEHHDPGSCARAYTF